MAVPAQESDVAGGMPPQEKSAGAGGDRGKSERIRESRWRARKWMVRGKVQYEQCFEAANQETPLTNPSVADTTMTRERANG